MSDGLINAKLLDFAQRTITFQELGERAQRVLGRASYDRCWKILLSGAVDIRNEIVLSMRNSPATGKRYRVGTNKKGKGVYHRASIPGNPPRPNKGDLIRSIVMDVRYATVEVGSNITKPPYPAFLEKGTNRMAARPWLKPAVDRIEPRIKINIMRVLRDTAGEFAR